MTVDPEARRTRVMIVEDHADFRDLMEVLLDSQPDIELLAKQDRSSRPVSRPRGSSWTWRSGPGVARRERGGSDRRFAPG